MKFYGIDLGTNNCVMSCLEKTNENTKIMLLRDKNNNDKIKSVVSLKDNENVTIAEKDNESFNNTFYLLKGKIGTDSSVLVNNKKVSVQFCTALLLRYLKNFNEEVNNVVITIPTFYNQSKRNATIEAAQQAGFNKVKLIEEPTAAVMYHIYLENLKKDNFVYKEKNVLVFDFGAGTLDLSLVNVRIDKKSNIDPRVINIDGLDNFGGYLIDILFAKALLNEARYEEGPHLELLNVAYEKLVSHISAYRDLSYDELYKEDLEINKILYDFVNEAERVKIALSKQSVVNINIPGYLNIDIDRVDFEEQILKNEMIIDKIEKLLSNFKLNNNYNIDEVTLVGGTSQMPIVKDLIKNKFTTSNIIINEEYINAVGYGSAIVSALEAGENIEPFGGNICTGVIPRDIFITCSGKEEKIFDRGTAYPLRNPKSYVFDIPFSLTDCIPIKLYEKDDKKCYKISDVNFYHPCFYTGDEIELIMDIDENGLLYFKARHINTDEVIEFISEKENSLNEKQILNGRKFIDEHVNFEGV